MHALGKMEGDFPFKETLISLGKHLHLKMKGKAFVQAATFLVLFSGL